MGLFAWLSFLAVPSIFAGGISTAFLMKYTGVKDHYVTYTGGVWLVQFQNQFSNVANKRICCFKGYCENVWRHKFYIFRLCKIFACPKFWNLQIQTGIIRWCKKIYDNQSRTGNPTQCTIYILKPFLFIYHSFSDDKNSFI